MVGNFKRESVMESRGVFFKTIICKLIRIEREIILLPINNIPGVNRKCMTPTHATSFLFNKREVLIVLTNQ